MKTPSREINLDDEESRDSLISSESQGKSLVFTHLNIHYEGKICDMLIIRDIT
jgi:hypothetical protein